MDLKQLEYFVTVVDLGGFSRAARLLGVAQPAISRQVRSLEVELRQNLLLRNGRGASADRGRQAPARARARHPAAGRPRARRGRRDQGCAGRPRRRRAAADARAARDRAGRPRVPAALSARVAVDRRRTLVAHPRVAAGRAHRRRPSLQSRCRRRRSTAVRCSRSRFASSAAAKAARRRARCRCATCPRYPLIIPEPARTRSGCWSRRVSRRSGLKPQVAMEIDAVSAILELVAEGHGDAVLSPRALHGADVARTARRAADRATPSRKRRSRSPRRPSARRRRCSREPCC